MYTAPEGSEVMTRQTSSVLGGGITEEFSMKPFHGVLIPSLGFETESMKMVIYPEDPLILTLSELFIHTSWTDHLRK